MLTIGKIAAVLGVHPDTIRNYEKRGIIPRARRSAINGYRIWEPEDLDRIREIFLELTYKTDNGRQ
jgi:DNA-binding transcriptional MerR regulator